MRTPQPSQLGALRDGFVLLRWHPAHALGLALLAMGLAQLGPALELAAGVAPSLISQVSFGFAGILPLEMYLIPRLQARLDAETLDTHGNPRNAWRNTFDDRWLQSCLARLGLGLAVFVGLNLFLVPGVVVLTLCGWVPLRMLLRGDGLVAAMRWNRAAMARHWPRIIQAVLAMLLLGLLYLMGVGWAMSHFLPATDSDLAPSALLRLRHPAFWLFNFTGGLLNLWLSCTLLSLFQRLEAAAAAVDRSP